jgi:hypothetical protein
MEFPPYLRRQLQFVETTRLERELLRRDRICRLRVRGELLGVVSDEIIGDPVSPVGLYAQLGELLLDSRNECLRLFASGGAGRRGRGGLLLGASRCSVEEKADYQNQISCGGNHGDTEVR